MSVARLERNTLLGLAASLLLALAKLAAGVLGHSSALVADAVESFADTFGSLIVWQGIRVAARPPDRDHPYGHGKAEAVAALLVGVGLVAAALLIIVRAFAEMLTPHRAPEAWTLLVLVGVIAVKEALFRFLRRSAATFDSIAAEADAWHHRSDAITSAAALIGVSIAVWGPGLFAAPQLVLADEIAALLASGIIAHTAMSFMSPALHELLDAAPHSLVAEVRRRAAEVPGVVLVEKIQARKSGRHYLVDLHLHVDPQMNVRSAHELSGRVKSHLRRALPAVRQVLIHVEPAAEGGGRSQ
ncbi:MAG: cation diffusion facilitator family transporter [Phycisphaerae bacterium]|nr:cation transporter [Phycisphaerae bacterium]MCZ2398685.1 cation diffusion facilitator family transporter [Phycisphaerae bacterium]NUQ50598.1 cation transporter [Phycisphaerae bacterium]